MQQRIRFSRGRPSDRTCCNRRVSTQRELARHQLFRAPLIQNQHHHIRLRSADLKADASPFDAYASRSRPSRLSLPAGKETTAEIRADDKGALLHARYDDDALRFSEQILRNGFVRGVHDLTEHLGRSSQTFGGSIGLGNAGQEQECGNSLHRSNSNVVTVKTTVSS